ncbi:hypothetical protein N9K78_04425 [Aquiluna sp.]|jgi:hypothetical protein|nr:hypothetical protein [Aquiluna sp.]
MIDEAMENPADSTAETQPSVAPGMGYPNHRVETSPEPIGWQGLNLDGLTEVSRETSEERSAD